MTDQVTVELASPADSALEKSDLERWKTARHASDHQRLADRFASARKMTDMIVGEVRRRYAKAGAAPSAMESRREAQLDALTPYRVVVVRTVDSEHIVNRREAVALATPDHSRNRPSHHATHHDYLEPERLHVLELGDRFVGRMH